MRLLTTLFLTFLLHLFSGCAREAQENYRVGADAGSSIKSVDKAAPTPQIVEPVANADNSTKAIFAVFEENKLNLYSSNLDGTGKQLLISEDSETRSGMFTAIKAKVSPAGNAVAARLMQSSGNMAVFVIDNSHGYKRTILDKTAEFDWSPDGKKLIYSAPSAAGDLSVFVIDSNGENKRKIVDKAGDPHWSPDGKKILYAVLQPARANLQDERLVGRPLWRNGKEWRVLNLESGADELLSIPEDKILELVSWRKDDQILFSSQSIFHVLYLSVINLQTKEKRQVKLIEGDYQVGEISTNSSTARTVMSILPDPSGIAGLCNYYQLSSTWQLGEHFEMVK